MTIEQVIDLSFSIIIFILTVTSAVFLVIAIRRNNTRRIALGAVLFAFSIFLVIDRYPEAGITFSAFSALALAVFAGLMLFENWRLRQDTREREQRDRKERLLNEIIEWATEIDKCAWVTAYPSATDVSSKIYTLRRRADIFSSFRASDAKSEYMMGIASVLGGELQASVEKVKKQLDKLLAVLWEYLKSKEKEDEKWTNEIKGEEEKLYELARELIKEAAKIKITGIRVNS